VAQEMADKETVRQGEGETGRRGDGCGGVLCFVAARLENVIVVFAVSLVGPGGSADEPSSHAYDKPDQIPHHLGIPIRNWAWRNPAGYLLDEERRGLLIIASRMHCFRRWGAWHLGKICGEVVNTSQFRGPVFPGGLVVSALIVLLCCNASGQLQPSVLELVAGVDSIYNRIRTYRYPSRMRASALRPRGRQSSTCA